MRAASISYRVADFLVRHPPFEWMEEAELVALAETGRVRFHEASEVLHEAGEERRADFAVIQQGTVELLDDQDALRDLLGPGDIVGIGTSEQHRYCARTASDVLMYVFPQAALRPLLDRHPRARRYLETVFSLAGEDRTGSVEALGSSGLWLDQPLPPELANCKASICLPEDRVRDVAVRMTEQGLSAVTIVDELGRPQGLVNDADFRAGVATGRVGADDAIGKLLDVVSDVPDPIPGGKQLGEYWQRMLRTGASALPVTDDRNESGAVVGVVTQDDLTIRYGRDPLVPILRIGRARSLDQVRLLRTASEAAIEGLLGDRGGARWAVEAAGALDVACCRRIIRRAEADLAGAPEQTKRCWVLLGAAGRRERFGAMPLGLGLVWTGPNEARVRMDRLADRVGADLSEIGFHLALHMLPTMGGVPTHGTLDEWKQAYDGWVKDPIGTGMYESLGFFDVLYVDGDTTLESELLGHLRRAIATDEAFLPLLANDSMAHLPPLTFFLGQVVDKAGERSELLHLENCAVRPLTDMARVFAFHAGNEEDGDTASRLRLAAARLPEHAELFRRSADAVELALRERARAAYASEEDRPEVRPESLLKVDRELLKSCFRTILDLLEYTAKHFGFPVPR